MAVPPKAQMPEHIRKMFEQKGIAVQQSAPPKPQQETEVDSVSQQNLEPENQEQEIVEQEVEVQELEQENFEEEISQEQSAEADAEEVEELNQETNTEETTQQEEQETNKKSKKASKEKKDKKKMSKKKKVLISVLTPLGVVLAAAIVLVVLHFIDINKQLVTPELVVYETTTGAYLKVEENDRATGYEFYMTYAGKTTKMESSSADYSLKAKVEKPGEYVFYARYIGQTENANSEYSKKVSYTKYDKLAAPVVTKKQTTLEWTAVAKATKYYVYYGSDQEQPLYIEQPATQNGENVVFDLQKINQKGAGAYTLYVVAVGNEENYIQSSPLSQPIAYSYTVKLEKPVSLYFDKTTNKLTINVDTQNSPTKNFLITINSNKLSFSYEADKLASSQTLDLSPFVSDVIISQISVVAVGDGTYTTNSDAASIVVQ